MPNPPIDTNEFVGRTNTFVHGYAGASVNVHTMSPHNIGDPGFIVGIPSKHERTIKKRQYRPADADKSRGEMLADPSIQSDPHAVMGTWTRGPEGAEPLKHLRTTTDRSRHIDTGARTQDMERAMMLGHRGKQDAIFDLHAGNDIKMSQDTLRHSRINAALDPEHTPRPLPGI